MPTEKKFSVGELALKMGVTVRTLQYYDKKSILKPSYLTEGGRRMYSAKDMVKLHQILSFKALRFSLEDITKRLLSLDHPFEIAEILSQQYEMITLQIHKLQTAQKSIQALKKEILQIDTVDFNKYADILASLEMNNGSYWMLKFFDKTLTDHVRNRFGEKPMLGIHIFTTYQKLLEQALILKRNKEHPDSKNSIKLAKGWCEMVNEFTGGDDSLLPLLEKFGHTYSTKQTDMAKKLLKIREYLTKCMEQYYISLEKTPAD